MRQVEENVLSLYASPATLPVGSKMQEESNESSLFSYKLGLLILLGAVGFFIYKKHQKGLKEKNADGNWKGENSVEEKKPDE